MATSDWAAARIFADSSRNSVAWAVSPRASAAAAFWSDASALASRVCDSSSRCFASSSLICLPVSASFCWRSTSARCSARSVRPSPKLVSTNLARSSAARAAMAAISGVSSTGAVAGAASSMPCSTSACWTTSVAPTPGSCASVKPGITAAWVNVKPAASTMRTPSFGSMSTMRPSPRLMAVLARVGLPLIGSPVNS